MTAGGTQAPGRVSRVTRTLALLDNPVAGKGRHAAAADAVADRLSASGFEVASLRGDSSQHSHELAQRAVKDGADVLAVMGGDGMVHVGAQACVGSDTCLAVIPAGTGNDTARCLDISITDPLRAAEALLRSEPRRIDVGQVGDAYFTTVLAAGFDSLVTEHANGMTWPRGQMRYTVATMAVLRDFEPVSYELTLDGQTHQEEAMLVAVGNGRSYGGGLRMCEGAEMDDGLLDVVVIKPLSKLQLLRLFPLLYRGTHVTHPSFVRHRVRSVSIAAPGMVAYADGERFADLPLTVDVRPRALTVLAPGV